MDTDTDTVEPPRPATREPVQEYLGNKEFLRDWKASPLTLASWWRDGTMLFAAQEANLTGSSHTFVEGLAKPYQRQFEQSPELVAALTRAFRGERISETLRIEGSPWDARLIPTFTDGNIGAVGGVLGIFADARARITAFRAVNTIDLQAQIRHSLARSESVDEFLGHCCNAVGKLHPATWIGLADRGEEKGIQVVTGVYATSAQFASMDLSWDIAVKKGRHPAAEAINASRTQVLRHFGQSGDSGGWPDFDAVSSGIIAAPLLSKGAALGVLVLHCDADEDFDAEMIGLWEAVAGEIVDGIELLLARQERARLTRERQGDYQQYQQLLDTIFDIVVFHRRGRVIEINPAGVRLFGATTGEELIGMQVLALLDPSDRERMKDTLREADGADELREFRLLSLDGASIDVEGITVSVLHKGVPARLSHWRDISQRRRAEKTILQQKTSLEYAQQVGQCGSVELEVASGRTEWSRNALAILGLSAEMRDQRFLDALSTVVADDNREELTRFIDSICRQVKEVSCEVTLKANESAVARTIHIHGIPQIEQHIRVPRIFVVVQDISQYRNAERELKQKLQATCKLARVIEWTYEIEKQIIVWQGSLKDFLGFDSPVPHLTYEQFMATIRPEDRELVRRAVEHTLKHGNDGEMVYEERFDKGLALKLYGRWRPEKNAAGKIVRLRGLSMDVTKIRLTHEREGREARIHPHSGLPERELVSDLVHHLTAQAMKFDESFSLIGIRIQDYPEIKRHLANDALYYRTQGDIAHAVTQNVNGVRIFGRLGLGCFVAVLGRTATRADAEAVREMTIRGWQRAFSEEEACLLDSVTVSTYAVHCPADGTEWERLLERLTERTKA